MRSFFLGSLLVLLGGCSQKEPVVAHGKPVSHWVDALHQGDARVRKKAVVALGHVGTADPAALPALMGAVKDRDVEVRREAVLALLNVGPQAREAISVLDEARKDVDVKVRTYAVKALRRVQGGD
jgi:HEAT repeat protein